MNKNKLTPKQKRFCQEYIISLNATDAAKKAGYSRKTADQMGYENLTKPYIQNYIQEIFNNRSNRLEVKSDNVLRDLIELKERCMQHQEIIKDGKCTGIYTFNANGALRALELIGKHLGMFKEKIEHSGEVSAKGKLEDYFK